MKEIIMLMFWGGILLTMCICLLIDWIKSKRIKADDKKRKEEWNFYNGR